MGAIRIVENQQVGGMSYVKPDDYNDTEYHFFVDGTLCTLHPHDRGFTLNGPGGTRDYTVFKEGTKSGVLRLPDGALAVPILTIR